MKKKFKRENKINSKHAKTEPGNVKQSYQGFAKMFFEHLAVTRNQSKFFANAELMHNIPKGLVHCKIP